MNVTIPYKPRAWALEHLHNRNERWKVLVIHRRAGKTTSALNHLQRDALKIKDSRFAFIAPTYKQAKLIAWDIIKKYARPIPGIEFNEVELTVKYPNGSKLSLYGADNPDSLRGLGLWGVVFDEYSQQPSNIFTEVIRPALADHQGYAIWIGTPKGRNEFYRLYEGGKTQENWHSTLLNVSDTSLIPDSELEDAKHTMSRDEFQQEWYCSFDAAIKGAVFASEMSEMRSDGRVGVLPYDKALKVYTVWDRGVGENLVVGFYQRSFGQLKKIDTWQGSGNDALPEGIRALQNKPYIYGKHFGPHDIEGTDASSGKTWKEAAEELNFKFEVVPKMAVIDRISIAQLALSHTWIDEKKNEKWLDAMGQYHYVWDEKRGMFKDEPEHDWSSHFADEFCYAAVIEELMDNESEKEFKNIEGSDGNEIYDAKWQ